MFAARRSDKIVVVDAGSGSAARCHRGGNTSVGDAPGALVGGLHRELHEIARRVRAAIRIFQALTTSMRS